MSDSALLSPTTPSQGSNEISSNPIDKRSSEDTTIQRRVVSSLHNLGYVELNQIGCNVVRGQVTLCGEISSYYLKQVAQTIALKVPGVGQVFNNIDVPN